MSTPSDPRTLVMHGLRLKGFGEAAAVAEAVGVSEADAKPVLDAARRRRTRHLPRRPDVAASA